MLRTYWRFNLVILFDIGRQSLQSSFGLLPLFLHLIKENQLMLTGGI